MLVCGHGCFDTNRAPPPGTQDVGIDWTVPADLPATPVDGSGPADADADGPDATAPDADPGCTLAHKSITVEADAGLVPGAADGISYGGASLININVVTSGMTAFTRDIGLGGNQLTDEIQKQLNVSYEEAEAYKLGGEPGVDVDTLIPQEVERVIQQVAEQMSLEVQRSLDFFSLIRKSADE